MGRGAEEISEAKGTGLLRKKVAITKEPEAKKRPDQEKANPVAGYTLKELEDLADVNHESALETLEKQYLRVKEALLLFEKDPEQFLLEKEQELYAKRYEQESQEIIAELYEEDADFAVDYLMDEIDDEDHLGDMTKSFGQEILAHKKSLEFALEDLEHDINFYKKAKIKEEVDRRYKETILKTETKDAKGEKLKELLKGLTAEQIKEIESALQDNPLFKSGLTGAMKGNGLSLLSLEEEGELKYLILASSFIEKENEKKMEAPFVCFVINKEKILHASFHKVSYSHSTKDKLRRIIQGDKARKEIIDKTRDLLGQSAEDMLKELKSR